jgi:uncharacterized delta-60 repeat protein
MGILNISQFPEFTGDSQGSIAVLNDSQNTQTYKIVRETLFTSSLFGTSSWANNSITASTTYLIGINGLSNSGSSLELGGTLYKNTIISGTKDGTINYLYPRSNFGVIRAAAIDHTENYIYMAGASGSSEEDWFTPGGIMKVNLYTNEIDPTFNIGNQSISGGLASAASTTPYINDIKVTSSGKLYIVGSFTNYNGASSRGIARLNPDGSRDSSFNPGTGFAGFNQANFQFTIPYGLFIDDNGKIVVFGSFTSYSGSTSNGIIRINDNGTVDTSFSAQTFNGVVSDAKKAADNKIYCVGTFTSPYIRIVRLNNNGSRDLTFTIGNSLNIGVTNVLPNSSVVDSQNRIIVVGTFTTYFGASSPRIIRINSDGSRDTTFNVGAGLVGTVGGLAYGQVFLDKIDRVYVAGTYNSYKGVTKNKLFRILPNGDLDLDFYSGTGFAISPTAEFLSRMPLLFDNYLYLGIVPNTTSSVFTYNGQSLGTSRTYIINVNENNLILSSSLVKYDEDNLASFTSRSLIDKDYADNRVARLATGSVTASLSTTSFTINTGSLFTGSLSVSESVNITRFFNLLTVSSSFDFVDDTAAGNAGIPLAGIYRSGSVLRIRLQ